MKYQEALNTLIGQKGHYGFIGEDSDIDLASKTLQQAIDKANKYDELEEDNERLKEEVEDRDIYIGDLEQVVDKSTTLEIKIKEYIQHLEKFAICYKETVYDYNDEPILASLWQDKTNILLQCIIDLEKILGGSK